MRKIGERVNVWLAENNANSKAFNSLKLTVGRMNNYDMQWSSMSDCHVTDLPKINEDCPKLFQWCLRTNDGPIFLTNFESDMPAVKITRAVDECIRTLRKIITFVIIRFFSFLFFFWWGGGATFPDFFFKFRCLVCSGQGMLELTIKRLSWWHLHI